MRSVVPVPEQRIVGSARYRIAVLPRRIVGKPPESHAVDLVTAVIEDPEEFLISVSELLLDFRRKSVLVRIEIFLEFLMLVERVSE